MTWKLLAVKLGRMETLVRRIEWPFLFWTDHKNLEYIPDLYPEINGQTHFPWHPLVSPFHSVSVGTSRHSFQHWRWRLQLLRPTCWSVAAILSGKRPRQFFSAPIQFANQHRSSIRWARRSGFPQEIYQSEETSILLLCASSFCRPWGSTPPSTSPVSVITSQLVPPTISCRLGWVGSGREIAGFSKGHFG